MTFFLQLLRPCSVTLQLIVYSVMQGSFSQNSNRQVHKGDILKDLSEDLHVSKPSGELSV